MGDIDISKSSNPLVTFPAVPVSTGPAPQTGIALTQNIDTPLLETGQRIGRTFLPEYQAKTPFDVDGDGDSDVRNLGLILFLGLYAIIALKLSNGVFTKNKYEQKVASNVLVWVSAFQLIVVWKLLNWISKVPCTKEKVIYFSFVFFTLTASVFLPSIVKLSQNKALVWSQISLLLIGTVFLLAGPISKNNLVSLAGLLSLLVSLIITATTAKDVNDDEV